MSSLFQPLWIQQEGRKWDYYLKASSVTDREHPSSISRLSLITILINHKMHLFTAMSLVGLVLAGPLRRADGNEAGKRDLVGGPNLHLSNSYQRQFGLTIHCSMYDWIPKENKTFTYLITDTNIYIAGIKMSWEAHIEPYADSNYSLWVKRNPSKFVK